MRAWESALLAQCFGREFSKKSVVVVCKPAQFPYPELGSDFGDGVFQRISRLEPSSNLVKCSELEIAHRSHAEVLLECGTQCSLRDTCSTSEVFHKQILIVMLIDEIHGLADDFLARNGHSGWRTRRPEVLTINGKAVLVIQAAGAYQRLLDSLEKLKGT